MDLQKSLEITRHVITKENQKLQELVRRSRDMLAEVKGRVENGELGEAKPAREPLEVEWFVRNIDEALAGGPWGLQEQEEFRAPEFPEAFFRMELRAAPEDGADAPMSLELCLEVAGPGARGLELRVGLLIETEEEAADAECQARVASAGLVKSGMLRYGEPVVVRRPWPTGACAAVCRAEVERAWPAIGEPLELTSTW